MPNPLDVISSAREVKANDFAGTGLDYLSSSNPMIDAYYKANPYVGQTYHKTIWDDLFSGIFRTGYDKWLDEMRVNSEQYNAGVVDLEQQNLYNSEVARAQRMRDAGENPDLLGTGDVSESAQPTADPQDVQLPEALDFSQVSSFAGMIAKCFQGALGMASAGIDLIGKVSDIDAQNISNAGNMQELALQVIRQNIPSEGFKTDADYLSWQESLHNLNNPDLKWNQSLAYSLGLSRHSRKAFDNAFNTAIGSLPAEYERFKLLDNYAGAKVSSARSTSSKFYDESFEVMQGISKELVSYKDELESIKSRLDVYEQNVREKQLANQEGDADIKQQYLDKAEQLGLGTTEAVVQNEEFNIKKEQQSIQRTLNTARSKILSMLQSMADDGNSFANYMIYNMMLHEYMNFDFKVKGDFGIGQHLPAKMKGWIPSFGADVEFGASM